ncbi:MAG: hypothetical protein JO024_08215 [Candidatus Eremiobacteraeota bacterium]|nr:hypothetical protein [Candidatus Eremiobacteraeota bacterium]
MPADATALRALVFLADEFHITQRRMKTAQQRMHELLDRGGVSEEEVQRYLSAINDYFRSFEREIRAHLNSLDGRLAKAYQVQFNLTAERAVAVKRMEATQAVIAAAGRVGDEAR